MSIFQAAADKLGRRKCRRCGKHFQPKKEGQVYGPKCERKEAASITVLEQYGRAAVEALA